MASTDIATRELENPMDLSEYLFRRLHEVGVRSVHGVPGDYNLAALDYLPKCGLNWVGNCNELNAGKPSMCQFGQIRRVASYLVSVI